VLRGPETTKNEGRMQGGNTIRGRSERDTVRGQDGKDDRKLKSPPPSGSPLPPNAGLPSSFALRIGSIAAPSSAACVAYGAVCEEER
jgi:hypothetical protein